VIGGLTDPLVATEDSLCALAAYGKQHLGEIDIWINNAYDTRHTHTHTHTAANRVEKPPRLDGMCDRQSVASPRRTRRRSTRHPRACCALVRSSSLRVNWVLMKCERKRMRVAALTAVVVAGGTG
jgi:hypothetical protein